MIYSGDINIIHGGLFYDISDLPDDLNESFHVEAVKVTDLDSACGANGMVMIESGYIYVFEAGKQRDSALSCIGFDGDKPTASDLIEACEAYAGIEQGGYESIEILQTDSDYSMTWEGFKAEKVVKPDDLAGYIYANYNVKN